MFESETNENFRNVAEINFRYVADTEKAENLCYVADSEKSGSNFAYVAERSGDMLTSLAGSTPKD